MLRETRSAFIRSATSASFAVALLLHGAPLFAQRTWGIEDGSDAAQTFPEPRQHVPRGQRGVPTTATPNATSASPSPRAFLDYSDGTFYLRSAHDNLIIGTGGRVHIDTYAFAGPGTQDYHRANGTGLGPSMFFRRFVLESGGLIRKEWFFWVGGNFAPTQLDSSANPMSTAGVYDGFIGHQWRFGQLYVGQFNTPITMENVTSSRWLDFMERALTVRTLAAPYNKDLGIAFWGATHEGVAPFEYQVGLFGGDGMNRPNVDDRVDAMARLVVHPLFARTRDPIHRFHVGLSGRAGSRNDSYVIFDAPALSTPGGYAFWSPRYSSSDGREIHVIPSGDQLAAAAELYVPFERVDIKSEVALVDEGRREAAGSDRQKTLRRGSLRGFGAYAQVSYWPFGSPRVNGHPAGRYIGLRAPKDRGPEHPFALQLLLRGEVMRLTYDANERTPAADEGGLSARTTSIQVSALQAAANYWATKHIRVTAEYSLYAFPGAPPSAGAATSNQAAAPGAKATPADPSADHLHELSFRVGLAL